MDLSLHISFLINILCFEDKCQEVLSVDYRVILLLFVEYTSILLYIKSNKNLNPTTSPPTVNEGSFHTTTSPKHVLYFQTFENVLFSLAWGDISFFWFAFPYTWLTLHTFSYTYWSSIYLLWSRLFISLLHWWMCLLDFDVWVLNLDINPSDVLYTNISPFNEVWFESWVSFVVQKTFNLI